MVTTLSKEFVFANVYRVLQEKIVLYQTILTNGSINSTSKTGLYKVQTVTVFIDLAKKEVCYVLQYVYNSCSSTH